MKQKRGFLTTWEPGGWYDVKRRLNEGHAAYLGSVILLDAMDGY